MDKQIWLPPPPNKKYDSYPVLHTANWDIDFRGLALAEPEKLVLGNPKNEAANFHSCMVKVWAWDLQQRNL